MMRTDRRVQRTRRLLQEALINLIRQRKYTAVTVQDMVDRANVGRTTFYLHYGNKDDLLIDCHESVVTTLHLWPFYPLSREELLSPQAPPGIAAAFQHLQEARAVVYPIFHGKENMLLLQRIRDRTALTIAASLRDAFAGAPSAIPLDVLANYLAGALLGLVQWWLEQRPPDSPENLAQAFHRLQRAALREAFWLSESESAPATAERG